MKKNGDTDKDLEVILDELLKDTTEGWWWCGMAYFQIYINCVVFWISKVICELNL